MDKNYQQDPNLQLKLPFWDKNFYANIG